MKRYQVWVIFCGSLLSLLSVFGCGGGGGTGGGEGGSTPPPPPQTVTLQGKVDDGLPHSPIANAVCRFHDLQGTPLVTATADSSGRFQLAIPMNMHGFLRCAPPTLSRLEMATFVSTVGRSAGETIANLTVDPTTTLMAAVLTNTHPADPQGRAAELIALLFAADPDFSLLAQASTVLYTAQLVTGTDVTFSSESDNESGAEGGGTDGGGHGDAGGTAGDAGDGAAFSPLPGASCDFALTIDGPVLRNVTLADLLANGTVGRPDLQTIASPVNAALAGQQAAIVAAFNRLFPTGMGRPIATTADANGAYFLSTPPGVRGFVRCNPSDAPNLVLSRFVPARQTGEQLMGQTVTPATTVAATVVTDALQAGLDPVPIQNAFLADIAPLQILLPDHPNGNGMFATVQLLPGTTLTNPNTALLVLAATTIFDAMRLQRATIPPTVTFAAAVQDYFQDATFTPPLAPLAPAVNTALDQAQPVIILGRNDIPLAVSTGTIVGTVTALNGTPLAGAQAVAQQGAAVQVTQTDASGHFTLTNVPPGATTVTATFGSVSTSRTLTVIAGGTVMLTVPLGSPCTAVTVVPPTALVGIGHTQQFSATVQGTGTCGSTVHWLVNGMLGGTATVGTITPTGLYTAPSTVPSPNPVTVSAVSDADPSLSGSGLVTVLSVPPPLTVTVIPTATSVEVGQTQQFSATVQGTGIVSSAVHWLVNGVRGGSATVGTITPTGLYTAPGTVPSPNTVTISAASDTDSTLSGSAQVSVLPPSPSLIAVTVTPPTASVVVGQTQQFSATVQGTGTFSSVVTWLVNNVPGGNATLGTISAMGVYAAPNTVPSPNPVTVTAVSVADPTLSGSAQVTVGSITGVTVSPPTAGVVAGQTQQFSATVQGTGIFSSAVTWLVNNVPGGNATFGTISALGLYTAPATVPSLALFTVTAVSVADPTRSGSAQVTVEPSPVVTVVPPTASVVVGQTQQFSAVVTSIFSPAVTWLVNNVPGGNATLGTISTTGFYTAPATVPSPNPVTVTAVSVADPTRSGSAQVTVTPLASTWIELFPAGGPSETILQVQHAGGYDGVNNRLILYFQTNPSVTGINSEVWILTHANGLGGTPAWIQLTPGGTLPNNINAQAITSYDAGNNRLIVYGGCFANCSPAESTVYVLTNANGLGGTPLWTVSNVTNPQARVQADAVYNAATNSLITFGGGLAFYGLDQNDTRILTNANGVTSPSTWITVSPTGGPPGIREGYTAVYDEAGDRMTIFAGQHAIQTCCPYVQSDYNDAWVLANASGGSPTWTQLLPVGGPPLPRGIHSAVYDPLNNRMFVFGGLLWNQATQDSTPLGDLWQLSNANGIGGTPTWTQLPQAGASPGPTSYHVAAFDPGNQRMIIFGGTDASNTPSKRVWLFIVP